MKKLQLNTGRLQLKKSKIMELTTTQASRIVGGTGITVTCTVPDSCIACDPTPSGPSSNICVVFSHECGPTGGVSGPACVLPPRTIEPTCVQFTAMDC